MSTIEFNQWKHQFLDNSTLSQKDKLQLAGDYSSKLQQLFTANYSISPDQVVFGSSCEYWPLLVSPNGQRNFCLAISTKGGMGYNAIKVQEYIDREIERLTNSGIPVSQTPGPNISCPIVPSESAPVAGSEPDPSNQETLFDVISKYCNISSGGDAFFERGSRGLRELRSMGLFINEDPEKKNDLTVDDFIECQLHFLDADRFLITRGGRVIARTEGVNILPILSEYEEMGICFYEHSPTRAGDEPVREQISYRTTLSNKEDIQEMLPYLNSIPLYHSSLV